MVSSPPRIAWSSTKVRRFLFLIPLLGLLCYGAYDLGFTLTNSRMERWRNDSMQALASYQLWASYSEQAVFEEDGGQKTTITGQVRKFPPLQVYQANVPVSDGSVFRFQAFLTGDHTWLHDLNHGQWVRAPLNHPELAELEQLQSPFSLWQLWISQADQVERFATSSKTRYVFHINHFTSGELSGYDLKLAKNGTLVVETGELHSLSRLEATIEFESKQLLRSDRIHYQIDFTDINQTTPESLPQITQYRDLP